MTIQFVGLVWMFWFVSKLVGTKTKREYKVADTSDAIYYTNHFDDNCLEMSKYTACNGDSIVYVDGSNLYRLLDNQVVLENVQICEMLYTDDYLYVLDDKEVFHIVNMESMEDYIIESVDGLDYDGEYIYLSQSDNKDIYYISEKGLLYNNEFIGFDKMSVLPNAKWLDLDEYQYQGDYYYWLNCSDGKLSSAKYRIAVCRSKIMEDRENGEGITLDDEYYITENNLAIGGEATYILYQRRDMHNKYTGIQGDIYCDGIVSIDFDNKKSTVLYETNDNLKRIIGFDYEKNIVYLYDVNNLSVNVLDLNTNQEETLDALPKKYNTLTFEKSRDNIFIYTHNNELVKIVELNK